MRIAILGIFGAVFAKYSLSLGLVRGSGDPAMNSGQAPPPPSTRQFKLEKESELRVEVGPDGPLRIRLLTGTAEIFGAELPPENWLTIPPRLKFAVSPLFFSFFLVFLCAKAWFLPFFCL